MPEAQHNLGICLSRGAGVEKNVAEGAMWLNSAAQQGDDEAERMLKRWWGD
jgi:TPR repeat protein